MKKLRLWAWLLWVILSGYVVAWILGIFILGPLTMYFLLTRRVIVRGYWRLVGEALRGKLLILTNHPTVFVETFLLGALLFPWFLVCPWAFVWTMPDKRLLDLWNMPGWMRVMLRCIVVDRRSRVKGGRGLLIAGQIVRARFVVVGNPEQGRTFGEANKNKIPLVRNDREMQVIEQSLLTQLAYETGARILPGYIEVPYAREQVSLQECFARMFGKDNAKHRPVILSFTRKAYRITGPFDLAKENERLQIEIMEA
ncbi:MAG: hypothetical protein JO019_04355 [Candidatus Kaiserbacteria bacterium]|nr:hypothetical protein [Candidatus Kaiserbacteria bacterium]